MGPGNVLGRHAPAFLAAAVLGAAAVAAPAVAATAPLPGAPPLRVTTPRVALDGVPATLELTPTATLPAPTLSVEIRDSRGALVGRGVVPADSPGEIEIVTVRGAHRLELRAPGVYEDAVAIDLRTIPGWLSLLPPFVAIVLALLFRHVVPALLAGIALGAWIGHGNVASGALRTIDEYLVGALANPDHVAIVMFSMLLAGMVGVMSRCGGTSGLVETLARKATTSRRGQLVTWLLGLAVFFDDYANTLVVGNTMRPVTDRLRISREKLAYIVDSTAAPVASVALISTWIGFEVSLIGDALVGVGSDRDAYGVFLQSIPFCFYPILALAFVLMVAATGRDFGPMRRAERRAAGGRLASARAVPLADFDHAALGPAPGKPRRWINAALPVVVVLCVTFAAQYLTGRAALSARGDLVGGTGSVLESFGRVFSSGNSFHALLYGAVAGCLAALALALGQRLLTLGEGILAWIEGMKTMVLAFVILVLAWSIGEVCVDLGTADYVVSALSGRLDPRLLPVLVFLFSALISFSTGSSWSTMSILVPLAVPSAFGVAQAAGYDPADAHRILVGAVSSVLAGSIFGDHCSPISDTTILSSMASGCDHVDHVKTQLPYAVLVALVGVGAGSLPSAFGLSPWLSNLAGIAILALALRLFGRSGAET